MLNVVIVSNFIIEFRMSQRFMWTGIFLKAGVVWTRIFIRAEEKSAF